MTIIYNIFGNILFEGYNSFRELIGKNKKNLSNADLSGADLSGADFSNADLSGANLRNCKLRGSDFSNADLRGANLSGTDLSDCDLSGAYLNNADLRGCDLSRADLRGCDLSGADLRGCDLRGAQLPIFSKYDISYKLNSNNFETSNISKIIIKIGCKEKNIKDWDNWFASDEEYLTKRGTEQFKQIQGNYIAVREFLKFMVE